MNSKKTIFKLTVLLNIILLNFSFCSKGVNPLNKPNIVIIYADDLGIGLLGHEGQKIIKTPNIDRLAKDGMRFTNAYSNMICSAARASLITGLTDCHQNKFEITNGGAYFNANERNISEIESSLNALLKEPSYNQNFLGTVALKMGYKTAQIGKLDWGFSTTHKQIKSHGWEYYFGYMDHERAHGFYPPFLFENGNMVDIEGNFLKNCGKSKEPETPEAFKERWNMKDKKVYSQTLFMEKAKSFITKNKNNPFLLYFPTQLPHGPVSIPAVHPDFINDSRLTQIEKEYASMVKLLDDNVGQLVSILQQLNLEDNTIVIFTADNGHEIYYSEAGRILKPYTNMKTGKRFDDYESKYYSDLAGDVFDGNGGRAGMKRSNLQGGINVPLVIKWPSKIPKNSTSKRLVANYDILPTISEICGYPVPKKIDGKSFYKELLKIDDDSEHEYVVYSSFTGPSLITKEGWKIRSYTSKNSFELYYLPNDFKEENNLAKEEDKIFNSLKIKLIQACDGDINNGIYSSNSSQIKFEKVK